MKLDFSSLMTRLLLGLALVFILTLGLVYWVIDQRGKPEVAKLTSETVVETGNEAVNGISARVNQIDGMAVAASRLTGSLPKDATVINDSFGNLMANVDDRIVGGGVWYDPTMFQADAEERAFVWSRDANGKMTPNPRYQSLNPVYANTAGRPTAQLGEKPNEKLASPYYREWWYVPVMYANHDHCVWSRAYIHPQSKQSMMTCAKAIFNAKTNGFEGVVSFDVLLSKLQQIAQDWQQKTGGYVFYVDMDNNFLTFPDLNKVKHITANNPQGEMMNATTFAQANPQFQPIADSLEKINQGIINKAKQIDNGKFEMAANTILSGTNLQRTTPKEAQIIAAMLLTEGSTTVNPNQNHFVEKVAINKDVLLNQPATAFIFSVPLTNWKMVVVKPNRELMAFANNLGKTLQWSMLLGFLPVLLLSAYWFRRFAVVPLRRVANEVRTMGQLIEQQRYLALNEHKLPKASVSEVGIISGAVNQLIDRIVENEGALAQVNERLEQQVVERTEHLNQALQDLKSSQVQLVQAEKMATLGQMVAGVAHEVNTPLGYVRSNLELIDGNLARYDELVETTQQLKTIMATDNPDGTLEDALQQTIACSDELVADALSDDLHGLISDAQFGVGQISELVISLRDFSRIDQAKIKEVDVNECIKNSLTMARSNIKYLQIIEQLGKVAEVSCNPSQINQVLLNLFNNAAQAMPDGHDGKLKVESYEDAQNVYIRVTDNGTGMSPEVMQNIFEPFFTTKKAGEGTGLGLAISAQIMEQHHGDIQVESQVGKGTRFTLRLPKTAPNSPAKPRLAIADDT